MISITDGQCGTCAHFGADHSDEPALVQIRVSREAAPDVIEPCGLPENASRDLKVSPVGTCAGYTSAVA